MTHPVANALGVAREQEIMGRTVTSPYGWYLNLISPVTFPQALL